MRRYLYLLSPVLVLASVSYALSQTLLTDEPPEVKTWEVFVKPAFALAMSAVGPFVTGYVAHWPPLAKYVIAGLASMVVGALAGQVPGFPLTSESAANMALGSGAAGQAMVNGWLKKDVPVVKSS